MNKTLQNKILTHIENNLNHGGKKGMVIASPSDDPPYKFHWVRDASLVMRVFIDLYKKNKTPENFYKLLNYINNSSEIQELKTLTGLGEPKINIDGSPYNEPWGRPQNDGPALRGINMISLFKIFKKSHKKIAYNLILPIIKIDLHYIIENVNKPCFDLWEEIIGWHLYTRVVQYKFLKEAITIKDDINLPDNLEEKMLYLREHLKHHIKDKEIISSFDDNGNIIRNDDASVLLAFCHVNFDLEIINIFDVSRIFKTATNLEEIFKEKYNLNYACLIGRYKDDAYYDGQAWILCSLALAQIYFNFSQYDNHEHLYFGGSNILNTIISLNKKLDLAEQYNPVTKTFHSAETLTWNYSELYFTTL
jgi:glucoamylase